MNVNGSWKLQQESLIDVTLNQVNTCRVGEITFVNSGTNRVSVQFHHRDSSVVVENVLVMLPGRVMVIPKTGDKCLVLFRDEDQANIDNGGRPADKTDSERRFNLSDCIVLLGYFSNFGVTDLDPSNVVMKLEGSEALKVGSNAANFTVAKSQQIETWAASIVAALTAANLIYPGVYPTPQPLISPASTRLKVDG